MVGVRVRNTLLVALSIIVTCLLIANRTGVMVHHVTGHDVQYNVRYHINDNVERERNISISLTSQRRIFMTSHKGEGTTVQHSTTTERPTTHKMLSSVPPANHTVIERPTHPQVHFNAKRNGSTHNPSNLPACPAVYRVKNQVIHKYKAYQTGPHHEYVSKATVLILTPVSNSANVLQHYFSLLCSLTYPHHLISIALGEDSSTDNTLSLARQDAKALENSFHSVRVFKLNHESHGQGSYAARHSPQIQLSRRRHLAEARNELLFRAISDEDWVLWIDSDVHYLPPDIIQQLMWSQKDIVVPSCMYVTAEGRIDVFDRNTWRETPHSLARLRGMGEDQLMLEGYSPTLRKYLPHLAEEGEVVLIDGVGGCTLLVRGDVHRSGLVFPTFVFDHHIETEGLGRMAKKMGYSMHGMPLINVFHQ